MDRPDRLACPHCRGPIDRDGDAWACPACARSFRSLRGIPDLRTAEDAYLSDREDWAFALLLDEAYDRLDFRGLLDLYFDLAADVPPASRSRQVSHILSAPGRAGQWLDALGPAAEAGPLLDLGCGSGSFLAFAAAGTGLEVWGVDIAMRWLLVARKRLDEEGLGRVRLVCGCAERLPIRGGSFAGIVGGDVIEHVADQGATLREAHRVLAPGGRVVLASPNRFSLAPEPHVGAIGVGYMPRACMKGYVRATTGRDFRAIRNLGYGEWRRLLRRSPFGAARVHAPALPPADLARFGPGKRLLAGAYNRAVGTAAGQVAARAVGPLFHVTATRDGGRTRQPADPLPHAPGGQQGQGDRQHLQE